MRLSTNHAYGFLGTVSRFKSVSFFTLICFLLQILWPSFVLAGFDTFESQDYVRLQLKKVDDISYDLRVLQKNAAGLQEINQARIQKAQLQGNVNLSRLFHVNLPASLRVCQLLLNPDDQLLLTAQNPIQDFFSIHTNIPLILGGIQGTLVDCVAPILTTIGRSHFDHLFYQPEDGQLGKLTFEHTQAQKGHFSICSTDLYLKTALTFDQVHTYGDIHHYENTLYGSTLWLHGNNFLAHDDLVFETCEAQPLGSLALCDDGGVTATFHRLKGHFHHLKAHRGSSLFVRGLLNDSFSHSAEIDYFQNDHAKHVDIRQHVSIHHANNQGLCHISPFLMDFTNHHLPACIERTEGLSGYEPSGRWSDSTGVGHHGVTFFLKDDLPQNFTLRLDGEVFGKNAHQPMRVFVGDVDVGFISLTPQKESTFSQTITIKNVPLNTRRLRFEVPHPQQPREIDPSNLDNRYLGVRFQNLFIAPFAGMRVYHNDDLNTYFKNHTGLSDPENGWRWSDAHRGHENQVTFTLKDDQHFPYDFKLRVKGGALHDNAQKQMAVYVDDVFKGHIDIFKKFDGFVIVRDVPPTARTLRFDIPHPQLAGNGDPRLLGVSFEEMDFIPITRFDSFHNQKDCHIHSLCDLGNVNNESTLVTNQQTIIGEFENKGSYQANGWVDIHRSLHNEGSLLFQGGRTALFGAIRNNGLMVSQKGLCYIHDPVFENGYQGRMDLEHVEWIRHPANDERRAINHGGQIIFGDVHGFKSYDNGGKFTINGSYHFERFINHRNDTGIAEAVFNKKGTIIDFHNAGRVKANELTLHKNTTHAGSETEIRRLRWANLEERLVNHGQWLVGSCEGPFYPRYITNHGSGHLRFQHNIGSFNKKIFEDRANNNFGMENHVRFQELANWGKMALICGDYETHDLHNEGVLQVKENERDVRTHFHVTGRYDNPGRIECPGNFWLKPQKDQDIQNLFIQGSLFVFTPRHVNGADVLRESWHARDITMNTDYFHNHSDRHFLTMPLTVHAQSFQNWKRFLLASLTVHSLKFAQHDMACLGTKGDLTLHVKGDVDNRHGRIHAQGNGRITAEGDVLNGAFIEDKFFAPIPSTYSWDGLTKFYNHSHPERGNDKTPGCRLVSNKSYIQSNGHLNICARNIENTFGTIIARYSGQNERTLLLQADGRIYSKSGLIESSGMSFFQSNNIVFETQDPLIAGKMFPNPSLRDPLYNGRYDTEVGALDDVERANRPQINILGNLVLASKDVLLRGACFNISGNLTDECGNIITMDSPRHFKIEAIPLYRQGCIFRKDGGRFGNDYWRTHFKKQYAHIPSTINVGGHVQLNFDHYQFDGAALLQAGGNIGIEGVSFQANADNWGSVCIHPLMPFVQQLPHGVLVALAPIVRGDQHLITNSQDAGAVYVDPIFGGGETLPIDQLTSLIQDGQYPLLTGMQNVQAGDRQALDVQNIASGILRAAGLCHVNLSCFRLSTDAWSMLTPFLNEARQLQTESGESALSLMRLDTSQNPLIAFLSGMTFVEGLGEVPVAYPFMYFPHLVMLQNQGRTRIKAHEGKVRIQVLDDLDIKKMQIDSPHDHVWLQGNNLVHLDQCEVRSKNIIMFGGMEYRDCGSLLEAEEKINITSCGPITFGASREVYERSVDTGTHKEKDYINAAIIGRLKAKMLTINQLGGSDVIFEGTEVNAPNTQVKMNGGSVHFKAAGSQFYTYRFDDDSNFLVQDVEQSMRSDLTFVLPDIKHDINIEGDCAGIIIDQVEKAAKKSGAKGYYTNHMLSLMEQFNVSAEDSRIYDVFSKLSPEMKDKVEYQIAKEVHDYEHKHHFGPGAGIIAAVGIIASLATWGAGASILGTTSGLTTAAANAAFSAFASSAAINFITCDGDLGKAFKNTFSDKVAKKVLFAAITAGICHQVLAGIGIDGNMAEHMREANAAHALNDQVNVAQYAAELAQKAGVNAGGFCYNMPELMQNIAEHGIRGVVGAGMNDLAGEDHPWKNIVRNCAANVVGQWGAGQIGDMYLDPQSIFHNPLVHKLAHGVVGGLSGSLMGGTGCVMSGAVGAMVGETLGCLMLEEPLSRQEQAVGGRMLTQAEYEAVSQKAYHDYQTHMMDVAKFAKIMTVMSAALTGLNVNVANQAAANAIDYNLLHVAAFGLLTVSLGYSAYCVHQAYKTDGVVGALKQLGIEIALNVAGVATGKFLVKVGGKLIQCECVKQALEVVYKNTPGLQTALSAIMPGIIAAIEAFDRTALGQLVGRAENQLIHLEDKLFRRIFDGNTVKVRDVKWGQGIHEQGMPFEDYIATKLPGDSRLPQNFKTFDYFDRTSKRAVSVKTLDTGTAARLENPNQMYGTLKRNIDAIINFREDVLSGVKLKSADIMSRELYLGIPHQIHPLQRGAIDRALDYAKLNNIKVELFHVY